MGCIIVLSMCASFSIGLISVIKNNNSPQKKLLLSISCSLIAAFLFTLQYQFQGNIWTERDQESIEKLWVLAPGAFALGMSLLLGIQSRRGSFFYVLICLAANIMALSKLNGIHPDPAQLEMQEQDIQKFY